MNGTAIEWPWKPEGDEAAERPSVCLSEMGKTIVVADPFDIDSVAVVTTATGRSVKSEPLRQLFETEGVDYGDYGRQWVVQDGTYIMSPSAKRKAAKMSPPGRASPKQQKKSKSGPGWTGGRKRERGPHAPH